MKLFYHLLFIPLFLFGITFQTFGQCDNDTTAPLALCADQIDISLDDDHQVELTAVLIDRFSSDNCTSYPNLDFRLETNEAYTGTIPTTTTVTFDETGEYLVALWVMDEAGNTANCWTRVKVINKQQECIGDTEAPVLTCLRNLQTIEGGLLFAEDFVRTATDNCSEERNITFNLELVNDFTGNVPTTQFLELTEAGIHKVYVWATDKQGNSAYCTSSLILSETIIVEGDIFYDENKDCTKGSNEAAINQSVRITLLEDNVSTYSTVTKSFNGSYSERILKPKTSNARIEVSLEIEELVSCKDLYTADLSGNAEKKVTMEAIGLQLSQGCADLGVKVEAVASGCSEEGIYVIQYYNGGDVVANPLITIDFSNTVLFSRILSSHAYQYEAQSEENKVYVFDVKNLQPGEGGNFFIRGKQICDFDNQTQVTTATIAADNACSNNWTGAKINIINECNGNEATFKIKNEGNADMLSPLEYIVIEDVIMRSEGTFQLAAGESQTLNLPATGGTYHVEAQQVADYPWQALTAKALEGCTTDPLSIKTGLVAQLPLENSTPHIDVEVFENKATDFNALAALPKGVGEAHLIKANTPIEYAVQYANNGTKEVAENLLISFKLSEHLDLNTLTVTYASRPEYVLTKKANNVVEFAFPNIALTHSSVSEELASGLLKFTVNQKENLAINTIIENNVSLQFNNRAPLKNTIFHTIGTSVLSTSVKDVLYNNNTSLSVYPNPIVESATFQFITENYDNLYFELYNRNGSLERQIKMTEELLIFQRNGIQSGFYFYTIKQYGLPVNSGKLFVK